jgi:hypothetical protein
VVKAIIRRTADDRVLATGHAEEIRGQGQVNSTSALENAETSAIGRALAALGCSGGEFASANELDGVERKKEAQANKPASVPERPVQPPHDPETGEITTRPSDGAAIRATWEEWIRTLLPEGHTDRQFLEACARQLTVEINDYKTARGIENAWSKYRNILARLQDEAGDLFEALIVTTNDRKNAIEAAGPTPMLTKAIGEAITDTLGLCEDEATLDTYIATLEPYQREHAKIIAAIDARRLAINDITSRMVRTGTFGG